MSLTIKIPSRLFILISTAIIAMTALVGLGIVVGMFVISPGDAASGSSSSATTPDHVEDENAEPQMYTCSMHPQVRLPDPDAKCPLCFMDLIPVEQSSESSAGIEAPVLVMSATAAKLAAIKTAPVRRFMPRIEVRMVGRIDYDETRQATISAYIPGRLDDLFVDFTGIPVSPGDHLVSIYSPELSSAEAELLSNLESFLNLDPDSSAMTRRIVEATVHASREKLRLWGLKPKQIEEIERTKVISDHMTIYSPIGGVVTKKHKVEGDYVKTGEPIYSVTDLSHLWVRLDAYESDLRWLRYGQDVEFTTQAFPGETFSGQIAFIDPEVSMTTRTVKLRVNVENPDGRLKPGMFIRAVVRPLITGNGQVVATDLAGRFVCPMHPEIVRDSQEPCEICGMDLKPAEELGYVSTPNGDQPPLVIPASAPLLTGTRAVVYVQLVDREEPTFEGRQIVLGPRAGDYYLVREDVPGGANLTEGELVVVNGNFKIDSSLQIQARTSMMNPPDRDESVTTKETVEDSIMPIARIAVTEDFLESLDPVYAGYLAIQAALADDDLLAFQTAAGEMHTQVDLVDDANLGDEPAQVWGDLSEALLTTRKHIQHVADLDAARSLFETYSNAMIELSSRFDYAGSESISIAYCFMAFGDKGASWLQTGDVIRNPYLGSVMPRCGEFKGAINTSAEPASQPASGGESVDE